MSTAIHPPETEILPKLPLVVEGESDVVDELSPTDFLRNYIRRCKPVVMTGLMDSWPAKNWSFEHFRELAEKQDAAQPSVLLEEGNVMQGKTSFRKQSFVDYLDRLIDDSGDDKAEDGYLSVFKLFDHFPELKREVDFSILDQHKLKSSSVGWIGPAGTVTGYHIDWGDNILAQIHGRKQLHLAAPFESSKMSVSQKFDQGASISEVDLNNWDSEKHPEFATVRNHRIVLQPGHCVFIPRGWWHHVQSLDKSISVSNIAYDIKGIVKDVLPHRIKQKLHDAGLWKCPCTCHRVVDGKWVRK